VLKLSEMQEIIDRATPAPWSPCLHLGVNGGSVDESCNCAARRRGTVWCENHPLLEMGVDSEDYPIQDYNRSQLRADAQFIATARTQWPALIEWAERAREKLKDYQTMLEDRLKGFDYIPDPEAEPEQNVIRKLREELPE
jgi:hypothetical protein